MKKRKTKSKRLLPQIFKAPNPKALKSLPNLEKEAELERIAKVINKQHAEIGELSRVFLDAGTRAIQRAIACGNWLRTVKATVKHGNFEKWCKQNLTFSIRKAQYYMLLAQKHSAKDVLRLNPPSLRQALIYAGALPEDTEGKHPSRNFDELAHVRKTIHRLMLELKANEDYSPEQLLEEIEQIVEWRRQLIARLEAKEKAAKVVDIESEVVNPENEKRTMMRFSSAPETTSPPPSATASPTTGQDDSNPQPLGEAGTVGVTPSIPGDRAPETTGESSSSLVATKEAEATATAGNIEQDTRSGSTAATITALALRRRYGPHYDQVLAEHLEEQETSGRRQFSVVRPLPTKAEYEAMLRPTFTKPIGEWLDEAFGTFEGLKGDYESWLENLPESLQESQKAEELQEAIDGFEGIENEDRPESDWMEWLKVFHLPAIDQGSRPKQLAEAQSILEDCAAELSRLVASGDYAKLRPTFDESDTAEDRDAGQDRLDPKELEHAASCLEAVAEAVNEISLPGMF